MHCAVGCRIIPAHLTVLQMGRERGDTNTGKALAYLKSNVFLQSRGMRPASPLVTRALVLISDGVSTDTTVGRVACHAQRGGVESLPYHSKGDVGCGLLPAD